MDKTGRKISRTDWRKVAKELTKRLVSLKDCHQFLLYPVFFLYPVEYKDEEHKRLFKFQAEKKKWPGSGRFFSFCLVSHWARSSGAPSSSGMVLWMPCSSHTTSVLQFVGQRLRPRRPERTILSPAQFSRSADRLQAADRSQWLHDGVLCIIIAIILIIIK